MPLMIQNVDEMQLCSINNFNFYINEGNLIIQAIHVHFDLVIIIQHKFLRFLLPVSITILPAEG